MIKNKFKSKVNFPIKYKKSDDNKVKELEYEKPMVIDERERMDKYTKPQKVPQKLQFNYTKDVKINNPEEILQIPITHEDMEIYTDFIPNPNRVEKEPIKTQLEAELE